MTATAERSAERSSGHTNERATERAERPVILTVDDDSGVSRAVARDLRRKYGDAYRIVRAESGPQALDALRELKLRGGRVAALLADHRMPEMTGVEFLEQAMDLYPRARRALLTAYADTDAAIRAINIVDVDHYLLKPWDPPEEKLYPVVDALLSAWAAAPDTGVPETKVVGHRFSVRSHDIRDFLARNQVPYRWFTSDEPEGRRLLQAAGAGPEDVPLVIPPEGEPLRSPSPGAVAEAVGLSTSPETDFYDLVIVGAGPAGLGSAVYGASEGLRTVLVERQASGGQAGQSSRIENYLGFPDGVSGAQLTDRARRQALKFGAEVLTAREVVGLDARGPARVVRFADGTEVSAHAVIVATGVSYRRLAVPGADRFTGRGVYYGSAAVEALNCQGEDVVIVGGANSAGQAAVFFSRYARRVHLLVRGDSLEKSMSHYLIEQIRLIDTIQVHTSTSIVGLQGSGAGESGRHAEHDAEDDAEDADAAGPAGEDPGAGGQLEDGTRLERVIVCDGSGQESAIDTSSVFVFIGAAPQTDWLEGVLTRDSRGFLLTGPDLLVDGDRPRGWSADRDPFYLETSVPGVFVAGDVRSESVKRVASAVGEGAMAVTLVHRYLEKL